MDTSEDLTQVARARADERIDQAIGELHKAATEIGKKHGIPENVSGHSIDELLGRISYVPTMARDLRRVLAQELARIELDAMLTKTSPLPVVPKPAPVQTQQVEPSKIDAQVPVGMDLSDLNGVTVQAVKALKAAGMYQVGDVINVPDEHLLKLPGIADKSLGQIRGAIAKASQAA